jgi:hypothetical protein
MIDPIYVRIWSEMSARILCMEIEAEKRESNIPALVRCGYILVVFALLICDWRSPLGLRTSSTNVDPLVFTVATVAIPPWLLWAARFLPPLLRGAMAVCAVILMAFAALVVLWNESNIAWMIRRGGEVTPLIATAPRGSGRVAAYQVETFPAGAYVRVRLEQPLVPGLLLFRDVATVDAPYIDGLTVLSPTSVCVSFSEAESALAEPHRRVDALLQFGALIRWTAPPQLNARLQSPSCSIDNIGEN